MFDKNLCDKFSEMYIGYSYQYSLHIYHYYLSTIKAKTIVEWKIATLTAEIQIIKVSLGPVQQNSQCTAIYVLPRATAIRQARGRGGMDLISSLILFESLNMFGKNISFKVSKIRNLNLA
jgi:hypothetical protein